MERTWRGARWSLAHYPATDLLQLAFRNPATRALTSFRTMSRTDARALADAIYEALDNDERPSSAVDT